MSSVKPYRSVPIRECGEKLAPVPREPFVFYEPHPYAALGAPYGDASPWMLRASVLDSLIKAQVRLQNIKPGWKILLFDAYRPNAVQRFMVERELTMLAEGEGLDPKALDESNRARLMEKVYRLFAIPSDDPATPPPHSTGGAIDCTLADSHGRELDMGSPIDENSDRSYPDYFAGAKDAAGQQAHANRLLLNDIMQGEGFRRATIEWWHFSQGDQSAIWLDRETAPQAFARYGRADLLPR